MLVTIVGARPQFIKAAVVSFALQRAGIAEFLIHTGQHYDENMSDIFWQELEMRPWDLNLHVGSGSHGKQTATMIERMEECLVKQQGKVKAVLLYGDTNSTLSGSIVASKLQVPIIHVEAGLRSFNRTMPEEINRIVTDHLSDLLFCSSDTGVHQLRKEAVVGDIHMVGDVMYDAVLNFTPTARKKTNIDKLVPQLENDFYLLTIHRPGNTDVPERLNAILNAVGKLDKKVLWPVHPRNKKQLESMKLPENLILFRPLSYLEMLSALESCTKVFTDSGGLQKEAYWCKKPCITLRDETEWVETIHDNWNIIVGGNTEKILQAAAAPVDMATWQPLYGTGKAADDIAMHIKHKYYSS
jgi:UDP-GlcNAc3NAcA epimerase